jgi:hypothetical protein
VLSQAEVSPSFPTAWPNSSAATAFVAVFVCACTIRAAERSRGYYCVLHQYVEQFEQVLTILVIFLLGGAVAIGLLAGVTRRDVLVALVDLRGIWPAAVLAGPANGATGAAGDLLRCSRRQLVFDMAYALEHCHFLEPEPCGG